jgi:hypothetical protein
MNNRWNSSLLLACLFLFASCDDSPPATALTKEQRRAVQPQKTKDLKQQQPENTKDLRQQQLAFLNRIRETDPEHRTIDRALINEQNELELILSDSVEVEKMPIVMRVMLKQMSGAFPGQDLTVFTYSSSTPPRKIGTAHLDGQTGKMDYTAE